MSYISTTINQPPTVQPQQLSSSAIAGDFDPRSVGYTFCASQSDQCNIPQTNQVYNVLYYDEQNRLGHFRDFKDNSTTNVICDNKNFGDPSKGYVKSCFIKPINKTINLDQYGNPIGWTKCSNENGTCKVDYLSDMLYGANGAFTYGINPETVACNSEVFGDPAPGYQKSCFVKQMQLPVPQQASVYHPPPLQAPQQASVYQPYPSQPNPYQPYPYQPPSQPEYIYGQMPSNHVPQSLGLKAVTPSHNVSTPPSTATFWGYPSVDPYTPGITTNTISNTVSESDCANRCLGTDNCFYYSIDGSNNNKCTIKMLPPVMNYNNWIQSKMLLGTN